MGIDWVAVAVFGAAYAFSRVSRVSLALRHWVFAAACFGLAGYRLIKGATNMVFVLIMAGLGVWYVVQAIRASAPRDPSGP